MSQVPLQPHSPTPADDGANRRSLWWVLAFIAVLMAYRIWAVPHTGISLFFDEAQYWDWSEHLAWGYFSKPPLIAGLIWLSTAVWGHSVLGVKLLTMLLYPASALAMWGLARSLWPGPQGERTGQVAAALFMTIPMVALMGLFASTDAPLILCWTLASWALWQAQRTDQLRHWALCGLACGVGLLGKYTMAAFALTVLWTLWAVPGPRKGLARPGPWLAGAVGLAMLSPNLIWNALNDFPTLAHTAELTTQSNRHGGLLPALVFVLGQAVMLGPLLVWGACHVLWRRRGASRHPGISVTDHTAALRFVWGMSLPLQGLAVVQAIHADAHVNWAAPSMVGFTLLMASALQSTAHEVSHSLAKRWLMVALLSNLALSTAVLHLREWAGPTMPSRLDVLVRMRGWQEVFAQLAPALNQPETQGLPILTDQRLLITEAAYNWRDLHRSTLSWNPLGQRLDHYQMTRSLPNRLGQDVVLLSDEADPQAITQRFDSSTPLAQAEVAVGPDRRITLHLFLLRGFKGYAPVSPAAP